MRMSLRHVMNPHMKNSVVTIAIAPASVFAGALTEGVVSVLVAFAIAIEPRRPWCTAGCVLNLSYEVSGSLSTFMPGVSRYFAGYTVPLRNRSGRAVRAGKLRRCAGAGERAEDLRGGA